MANCLIIQSYSNSWILRRTWSPQLLPDVYVLDMSVIVEQSTATIAVAMAIVRVASASTAVVVLILHVYSVLFISIILVFIMPILTRGPCPELQKRNLTGQTGLAMPAPLL